MTEPEQKAIDAWFDACQKTQPPGTLAALVYVRDGEVHLGRGGVALEANTFPSADADVDAAVGDLQTAEDLIAEAIDTLIDSLTADTNAPVVD